VSIGLPFATGPEQDWIPGPFGSSAHEYAASTTCPTAKVLPLAGVVTVALGALSVQLTPTEAAALVGDALSVPCATKLDPPPPPLG
jgi:hypothetical protein